MQQTFLSEASFEALLGAQPFVRFGDQLLFYQHEREQYVIATLDPEGDYTATDFFLLPEGAPYQLINGKFVYSMAPSIKHQDILLEIATEIKLYLREHNLGKVFVAPTDVKLGEKNVFQPDILFVSVGRKSQIEENRIIGAPDLAVEILSKSTENYDRSVKMEKYAEYDVVEYWIVHPKDEYIEVYHNEDQQMQLVQTATAGDSISSKAIEGFVLDVARVF